MMINNPHKKKCIERRLLKTRLKASSLVEVLVAVAVCMLVFSVSMMILLKVDRENNVHLRLKADLIQQQLEITIKKDPITAPKDTIILEGLVIYRNVEQNDSLSGIWTVTHRIFSKNGTPLSVKKYLTRNITIDE